MILHRPQEAAEVVHAEKLDQKLPLVRSPTHTNHGPATASTMPTAVSGRMLQIVRSTCSGEKTRHSQSKERRNTTRHAPSVASPTGSSLGRLASPAKTSQSPPSAAPRRPAP